MKNALGKLIDLIIRVTLFAHDNNISTPDMLGVSASEVSRSRGGKDSAKTMLMPSPLRILKLTLTTKRTKIFYLQMHKRLLRHHG